jgi:hypothetical protein
MNDPHDRPTAAVDAPLGTRAREALLDGVHRALADAGFDPRNPDRTGLRLCLHEHGVLIEWRPADTLGSAIQVRDGQESRRGLSDLDGISRALTEALGQILHDAGYRTAPGAGGLLLVTGARPLPSPSD